MGQPKFVITKNTRDDKYYFDLKAGNGESILESAQGYTTKQSCGNSIDSVKEHSFFDGYYERINAPISFKLKASNGKIIGKSQVYVDESSIEVGIESVKSNAHYAEIEELD